MDPYIAQICRQTSTLLVMCCPEGHYTSPISSHHGKWLGTTTLRAVGDTLFPKISCIVGSWQRRM